MKKFFGMFMILFMSMFIFGCSNITPEQNAMNTVNLAADIVTIETSYSNVYQAIVLKQAQSKVFTDEEWSKLKDFHSVMKKLQDNFISISKGDLKNADIGQLNIMVALGRTAYSNAKSIVTSHMSSFDPITQSQILSLQTSIDDINKSIDTLLADPKASSALPTINLILSLVGTSVKVLSMAALL